MFAGLFGQPLAPPIPDTYLDSPESPVQPSSCSPSDVVPDPAYELRDSFRHSSWRGTRLRIFRAMCAIPLRTSRRTNFSRCGSSWWVQQNINQPERFRIVLDRCHDRFCTPCSVDRRDTIRRNLATRILNQPHRFLTLTLRHTRDPLADQLNRLYRSFRKLRQRSLWKERVTGGAAFLEIGFNPQKFDYHPHLHIILEGRFIPAPQLRTLWLDITGDSHNVDIRYIPNAKTATDYVTKYATKPLPHQATHCDPALREIVLATAHRRTIVTFGRWRNWHLTARPDDAGWKLFGHVDEVAYKAANADPLCERVHAMLQTADPRTGEFFVDLDIPAPDE